MEVLGDSLVHGQEVLDVTEQLVYDLVGQSGVVRRLLAYLDHEMLRGEHDVGTRRGSMASWTQRRGLASREVNLPSR